jgi:hypothetical protein
VSQEENVEHSFLISNEFASVVVRKVRTGGGERLELCSMRDERRVRLDALVLESLTWCNPDALGRGLETPFGPEMRPDGGPSESGPSSG